MVISSLLCQMQGVDSERPQARMIWPTAKQQATSWEHPAQRDQPHTRKVIKQPRGGGGGGGGAAVAGTHRLRNSAGTFTSPVLRVPLPNSSGTGLPPAATHTSTLVTHNS